MVRVVSSRINSQRHNAAVTVIIRGTVLRCLGLDKLEPIGRVFLVMSYLQKP